MMIFKKILFRDLLDRSPRLLRLADWLNRTIISRTGIKIVPAGFSAISRHWPEKLLYFNRLLMPIDSLSGDIVECGVGSGATLTMLALSMRNSKVKRHIWGFDSFEGLPSPSKEDLVSPMGLAKKGLFSNTSRQKVIDELKFYGFGDEFIDKQVTLVEGRFSEMLPKYKGSSIAFLHVDVDLYNSCKTVLENLFPRVAVGGVVALDDYDSPERWPGMRKAVDEYCSHHRGSMKIYRDDISNYYYAVRLK
jgi:O-methyltransferase